MNLESYFFVFDQAVPSSVCDDIVAYGNSKNEQMAVTGDFDTKQGALNEKDISKLYKTRNSSICWLNDPWISKEVLPYINLANKEANWNFEVSLTEDFQFTKYAEQQHYTWHADAFNKPSNKVKSPFFGTIRKLSATLSLVDGNEYEGGDLEFDLRNNGDGSPNIQKVLNTRNKGSLVVFPSFVYHRVTPVTKGTRYSLVVWCSGNPYK
jgi:PKHD-type hydroxylase